MKSILVIFLLLQFIYGTCQDYSEINLDTLNKYGEKGKKTGSWVEFLNNRLHPTEKLEEARFFWFVLYENGIRVFPLPSFDLFKKDVNINILGNLPQPGEIILTNGTYLMSNSKDSMKYVFIDGHISSITQYYRNGNIYTYMDFNDRYHSNLLSYSLTGYNSNGSIETSYFMVFETGKWHLKKKGK